MNIAQRGARLAADGGAQGEAVTLASLANVPCWVAWQTEPRRSGVSADTPPGPPTKMPYAPKGSGRAASNDPATWGTRAQAEERLRTLPRRHGPAGVGVMLGKRLDTPALALGGVDLDSCRDPGTGALTPWAAAVIARFATYGEVSPSGTGVKLYFQYRVHDRAAMHALDVNHGRAWKRPGGEHPPAIEFYLGNRFFAVTEDRLPDAPEAMRIVTADDLTWLVRVAGPSFAAGRNFDASGPAPGASASRQGTADAWRRVLTADDADLRDLIASDFAGVKDQSGSGIAFALGGAIKAAGFTFAEMCDALRQCPRTASWAKAKGEAAGGREFERIWSRAQSRAGAPGTASAPRPLFTPIDKPEPFPMHALGGVLGRAAKAVQQATQAPAAICAQSVLGVAALAVQPFANVILPTGQARPVSLYLMTIAASGERKSSADEQAMLGVRARERMLADGYQDAYRDYRNDLDVWKRARERILSAKGSGPGKRDTKAELAALGAEPVPPVKPLIVMTEPTWEGLVKLLPEAEPSLGLFSAEGGAFLGGHGMSDDARMRTAAGLSEAWDGVPIRRVRGGDGAAVYHGRRLSLHLMVQPEVALMVTGDTAIAGEGGQGLLNRFLVCHPESTAGTRLFRDVLPETERILQTFAADVAGLLSAPKPLADGQRHVLDPRALPLSPEARALWIAFHDDNERALGPSGAFAAVAGFANKAPEHAARLAAVLTLFEVPDAAEISAEAMANGITLATFYRAEALRLVRGSQVPAGLRAAERLRVWLCDGWPEHLVSLPDIYQRGPCSVRNAAEARAAVDVLVKHGWLVPEGEGDVGGKRRKEVWRVMRCSPEASTGREEADPDAAGEAPSE